MKNETKLLLIVALIISFLLVIGAITAESTMLNDCEKNGVFKPRFMHDNIKCEVLK